MDFSAYNLKELQTLEESLWQAETRFNLAYMDRILAPDFFEFGRSGKTYTREQSLSAPAQAINAKLPLRDFQVHQITAEIALITYISEVQYEELEIGNRSSLWIKANGNWQLKFHQGTPKAN